MTDIQTSSTILTQPTQMLKGIDSNTIPDLEIISEDSFKRYVYTGIDVVIDTPILKTSRNAILAINPDGFIPWFSLGTGASAIYRNLFPVQVIPGVAGVRVFQEMMMSPFQALIASHRFMSGSVGIGIRVTSNTSQPGNLLFSQGSGLIRDYKRNNELYGFEFLNSYNAPGDFNQGNFALVDLSLNRQFSIKTTRRDPNKRLDIDYKINFIAADVWSTATMDGFRDYNNFATQMQEDWIFVTPLTSIPNNNANQLNLTFFFDYSNVNFEVPIFPTIPTGAINLNGFLNVTASFNGVTAPLDHAWIFGPPTAAIELSEDKVDKDKQSKELKSLNSSVSNDYCLTNGPEFGLKDLII